MDEDVLGKIEAARRDRPSLKCRHTLAYCETLRREANSSRFVSASPSKEPIS